MANYCRFCGAQLKEGARFCVGCGQPVVPDGAPAQGQPPYQPPHQQQQVQQPPARQQPYQQPYPTQPYRQPYQQPPQPASAQPAKKKRTAVVVLAVALCVVLVAVGITGFVAPGFFLRRDSGGDRRAAAAAAIDLSGVEVELPCSEGVRAVVEAEAADTLSRYVIARAYLEMLTEFDTDDEVNFDAQAYMALFEQTVAAFETAGVMTDELEYNAAALEEMMDDGYTGLSGSVSYREYQPETPEPSLRRGIANPFILRASAAEDSEALKWAKELTEAYDKAPVGRGLRTLAQQMGTDVKHAYAMLKQAQAIIEGDGYGAEADAANRAYQIAVTTKAAATTAGFAVSVVASGGATGIAAAIETAGVAVNGVNAVLDVGIAGTTLWTNGEGNKCTQILEKASKDFEHVSFIVGALGAGSGVQSSFSSEKVANLMNSALFFVGQSEYLMDNFSDFAAMQAKTGPEGARFILEKCSVEKTAERLKTAGQMLLDAGFPAKDVAAALAEAAKHLPNAAAETPDASEQSGQNAPVDAPSEPAPPSGGRPDVPPDASGAPAEPPAKPDGAPAQPSAESPNQPPADGSGQAGGGFTGDPEKIREEWTGPKEKEDDFDIDEYINRLREVLYEIAGLEMRQDAEEPPTEEPTETAGELPLSAENVSGTYYLAGMIYATGDISFEESGAQEQAWALTVTVTPAGETGLQVRVAADGGGTAETTAAYDPETGICTDAIQYYHATLTFTAEGDTILAAMTGGIYDEDGSITFSISGSKQS